MINEWIMIYHQWLASGNHSSVEEIAVILPQKSEWWGLMIKGCLFTNHTKQPYLACSHPCGSVLGLNCINQIETKTKWLPFCIHHSNEILYSKTVCIFIQFHYRQVSNISAWQAPSHYLNQWWNIGSWTLGNKLQWNLYRNLYIFIQENAFENVVMKLSSILSRPQCVKVKAWCQTLWAI